MASTHPHLAPDERIGDVRGKAIGPVSSFDGTMLYVEEIGSGPTIVLSHGMCLDISTWHFQMRDLADSFRLVAYNHRGHGRSEQPRSGDWTMEAFARDLAAVLEATCEDETPVVVGHSLGGMVILQYASMFHEDLQDRVGGLFALGATDVDPAAGLVPAAAPIAKPAIALLAAAASRSPGAFDRVRRSQSTIVAALVKLMGFGPGARRNELAFIHHLLESTPAEVLVATFAALRSIDVHEQLRMVDVPTIVAVGSRDRLTPPASAKRIAHEIHGAELWTLRGAGHMAQLEKPDLFNERLRAFASFPGAHYGGRRIGSR